MVVEVRGDNVRLGIEAPKEVPVHRREVYEKIKKAERTGASSARRFHFQRLVRRPAFVVTVVTISSMSWRKLRR